MRKTVLERRRERETETLQARASVTKKCEVTEETLVLRKLSYGAYLRTPHWKAKRRAAFQHYGRVCLCGTTSYLQVHHRSYGNVGCEPLVDLSVMCKNCHQYLHGKVKRPKLGTIEFEANMLDEEFEERFGIAREPAEIKRDQAIRALRRKTRRHQKKFRQKGSNPKVEPVKKLDLPEVDREWLNSAPRRATFEKMSG